MTLNKAIWGLHTQAVEEKLDKGLRKGKRANNVSPLTYYRWGTIIYSVRHTDDKISGEPISLVITISDQRTNKNFKYRGG